MRQRDGKNRSKGFDERVWDGDSGINSSPLDKMESSPLGFTPWVPALRAKSSDLKENLPETALWKSYKDVC